MIPKNSPLSLVDIYIVASNIMAIHTPDGYEGEINSFPIEIDFDLYQLKDDESNFKIMISVDGNDPKNPVPGYCFNLIAEGIFNYKKDNGVKSDDKDILLSHSAIPIVIGHLRSHLMSITSAGPYDKYILPVVDLSDLLHQKSELTKESE